MHFLISKFVWGVKMLDIHRHKWTCMILISLVLLVWQFYLVNQSYSIENIFVETFLNKTRDHLNVTGNEGNNEKTRGSKPKPIELKATHERYELMEKYEQEKLPDVAPAFKRILFWNDAYGNKEYGIGFGREVLRKWECPVWQCETSENRTNVQDYDAVVFHLRTWTQHDLPQKRSPNQRYVAWIMESAAWREYLDTSPMGYLFNWTMTYRWDSDMVGPYGYVKPIGSVPIHPSESQMKQYSSNSKINYANGKTKMAAWFVSNCNSKSNRNKMVKELQKYIDVDVYGVCGPMNCSREIEEECREMAAKNYKFYLSLENSLCQDYVTEKFFSMLHHPILPIVYGVHDHYDKIAPSHSFINAAKFENMKQLADYLILLDKNDTLYNEYFWWKGHFEVRYTQKDKNKSMCHLCAALHNTTLPPKIYRDMTDWWENQSSCVFSPPIS